MAIVRNKKEKEYTPIDNKVLQNENLSWKARGILVYLLSLPQDWDINLKEIARHATDGKASLRTGIKELRKNNYIRYKKVKDDEGHFQHIYNVYENPHTENPDVENPDMENPDVENHDINKRNNEQKNEEQKNKINKYKEQIKDVHTHWLKKCKDIHNARLTKNLKERIANKLKRWNKSDIIEAISNYAEVYYSDYYYSHNFTLYKFVKQKNGAPRFKSGLDQEYNGDIYKDYQKEYSKNVTTEKIEDDYSDIPDSAI